MLGLLAARIECAVELAAPTPAVGKGIRAPPRCAHVRCLSAASLLSCRSSWGAHGRGRCAAVPPCFAAGFPGSVFTLAMGLGHDFNRRQLRCPMASVSTSCGNAKRRGLGCYAPWEGANAATHAASLRLLLPTTQGPAADPSARLALCSTGALASCCRKLIGLANSRTRETGERERMGGEERKRSEETRRDVCSGCLCVSRAKISEAYSLADARRTQHT